jgi:hypothetical protein
MHGGHGAGRRVARSSRNRLRPSARRYDLRAVGQAAAWSLPNPPHSSPAREMTVAAATGSQRLDGRRSAPPSRAAGACRHASRAQMQPHTSRSSELSPDSHRVRVELLLAAVGRGEGVRLDGVLARRHGRQGQPSLPLTGAPARTAASLAATFNDSPLIAAPDRPNVTIAIHLLGPSYHSSPNKNRVRGSDRRHLPSYVPRPIPRIRWATHLMHAGSSSSRPDRPGGLYPFGWV